MLLPNCTFKDFDGQTFSKKHNIDELYEGVKQRHESETTEIRVNVQHPGLVPSLRRYQKEAVLWMLSREKYNQQSDDCTRGKCLAYLIQFLLLFY